MQKNFDQWNEHKKYMHVETERKFYHPREVWWCSLGVNVGFEEDGTGSEFERPVLILKGFSKEVCLIVPLTTSTKVNPYHVKVGIVDSREAFAIISQIRLIDTKRLSNKVGRLKEKKFEEIKKAVKGLL